MAKKRNGKSSKNKSLGKTLKFDFVFLVVLCSIVVVLEIFTISNFIPVLLHIGYIVGFSYGISLVSKKKKAAGIVGIVFAILLMLAFFGSGIVSGLLGLLGLLLFIHSIKYLIDFNS